MRTKIYLIITAIFFAMGCNKQKPFKSENLIYLENSKIKIGILTDVGGRMVFFGANNGSNLLKSDTSKWNEADSLRIKPSAFSDFKAYYGMITWVGPQLEWWKHQKINEERLKSAAVWPPDPFLIYGKYQIIEKTDSTLKIQGPESPVSGLQLTKEFRISDNRLQIKVTAKNISDTIVSWDLWTNARFDSKTKYMVPTNEKGLLRVSTDETLEKEKMNYLLENGVFHFVPQEITKGKKQQYGKAFIYPEVANLLAIKDNYLLKISFEKVAIENIHPEQALVEIFQSISNAGGDDLLELEHHSEFKTLKPGETFHLSETWSLHKTNAFNNQQEILDFLYKEEN